MSARNKPGRPSIAERMNLLADGAAELAEAIKLRLMAKRDTVTVYVDGHGVVRVDPFTMDDTAKTPPASWIVGTYVPTAALDMIEDDLAVRLAEIRGGVAA